jgi:predicted enzyme related to lactoylglutathione lyase
VREQHGGGPEHLANDVGGMVFEIYPQGDLPSTSSIRLGFRVTSLAATLAAVATVAGEVIAPARESPWGIRAIVVDPDGHRVELLEVSGNLSSNANAEAPGLLPPF